MLCVCFGHVVCYLIVYCWYVVGMLWMCSGHAVAMLMVWCGMQYVWYAIVVVVGGCVVEGVLCVCAGHMVGR